MLNKLIRIISPLIMAFSIVSYDSPMATEPEHHASFTSYLKAPADVILLFEQNMDFKNIAYYSLTSKNIYERVTPQLPTIYIKENLTAPLKNDEDKRIMRILVWGAKYVHSKDINHIHDTLRGWDVEYQKLSISFPSPPFTTLINSLPKLYTNRQSMNFLEILEYSYHISPECLNKICSLIDKNVVSDIRDKDLDYLIYKINFSLSNYSRRFSKFFDYMITILDIFKNISSLQQNQQIPAIDVLFESGIFIPKDYYDRSQQFYLGYMSDYCKKLTPEQIRASSKLLSPENISDTVQEDFSSFTADEIKSMGTIGTEYRKAVLDIIKKTDTSQRKNYIYILCKFFEILKYHGTKGFFGWWRDSYIFHQQQNIGSLKEINGHQLDEWTNAFLTHADVLFLNFTDPTEINKKFHIYCKCTPEDLIADAQGIEGVYNEKGLKGVITYYFK